MGKTEGGSASALRLSGGGSERSCNDPDDSNDDQEFQETECVT
jgi:hypothetical protein